MNANEWDGIALADVRCRGCEVTFEARARLVRVLPARSPSSFLTRLDRPCPGCGETEGHFSIYGRPERWVLGGEGV